MNEESATELEVEQSVARVTITGNVSAAYSNGNFVLWSPKEPDSSSSTGATSMTSMATSMSSASGDNSSPPSIRNSINVIAEAPIQEDGTFHLETTVGAPQQVYFYVLDAVSAEGRMLAPTKGQQLILEPGELTLTMDAYRKFVVKGGYFNDEVFNSWKESEDYQKAQTDYQALLKTPENETDDVRDLRMQSITELSSSMHELETEGRIIASTTHADPQVRKLVLQTSWLIGDWYRDALLELEQLLPEDQWVKQSVERANERFELLQEQERIAIGSPILEFEAEYLNGDTVALMDLTAGKSLVLLEFWASWCGPCRVEIPHMKEAYDRFKDKGFEIISFTIDEFKEDWEEASAEEELPWINLGMGPKADAPTAYSVTGVPNNYLFDAESGTIIAKDLRGVQLDQKLEEELL